MESGRVGGTEGDYFRFVVIYGGVKWVVEMCGFGDFEDIWIVKLIEGLIVYGWYLKLWETMSWFRENS